MRSSEVAFESMGRPLVTIAIPTFNRAALLRECIEAALSQTYENIEVLVSNNASTDDTSRVLREFDDQRLRVLTQETNIGLLPNWNACLAAAAGDYVIFVSDDDRISPSLLDRCVETIGGHSEAPIVVALSDFRLSTSGRTKPARVSKRIASGLRNGIDVLSEYLTDQIDVTMCCVLLRTQALRSRGGFPLDFPHTADVAAWAPLLFQGEVGFVNEPCATYNFHQDSETGKLGVAQILCDGGKIANLISGMADECIEDRVRREDIKLQARRCFSRRGLVFLTYYRSNGASLLQVLALVWRFRADLMVADKLSVLRFAAIILCPRPVADGLRQLKQSFFEGWRDRETAVKPG
jgi:glycosyltransferase involved in cell wall biosynthesis